MKTKLELECELLMLNHSIKHEQNNRNAHQFRGTLQGNDAAACKAAALMHHHNAVLLINKRSTLESEIEKFRVAI